MYSNKFWLQPPTCAFVGKLEGSDLKKMQNGDKVKEVSTRARSSLSCQLLSSSPSKKLQRAPALCFNRPVSVSSQQNPTLQFLLPSTMAFVSIFSFFCFCPFVSSLLFRSFLSSVSLVFSGHDIPSGRMPSQFETIFCRSFRFSFFVTISFFDFEEKAKLCSSRSQMNHCYHERTLLVNRFFFGNKIKYFQDISR